MQVDGLGSRSKQYATALDGIRKIYLTEGLFSFYNGLTATIARQGMAASARLGVYTTFFKIFSNDDKPPSFAAKVGMGMLAGVCGGLVGTPADVCLIRMVTDGAKPPQNRFYYKHIFHAIYRICRDEGIRQLWKGGVPTILRGIVFNGTALSSYSQSKQIFLDANIFEDNSYLHFTASIISGLITSAVVLPVDLLKTRIQQSYTKTNIVDVFLTILKREGLFAYWKGFTPYVCRIIPYNTVTLVLLEQLTYYYNIYILRNKRPRRNL